MTYFLTADFFSRSLFYIQHVWYFYTVLHPTGRSGEVLTPFYVRIRVSQKRKKQHKFSGFLKKEEGTVHMEKRG